MTEESAPAFFGQHPWPERPRRIVPDMTAVSALQVGHPIAVFILMKTDDDAFHLGRSLGGRGFCDGRHHPAWLEIRDGPHAEGPLLQNQLACLD